MVDYLPYIACISVSILLSVLLPVILLIVWHKKTGARLLPALIGAIVFPIFALGLEQLLHAVVLKQPIMQTNAFLYVVYGCLAAGLFEETGRLVAFRFLLRKHRGRETAVTYGIGHGGIEAILTAGVSMSILLIAAILLAGGNGQSLTNLFGAPTAQTVASMLTSAAPAMFMVSGLERVIAISLHISLSVFVFKAVTEKKPAYYFMAILFHASVNSFAALYQIGVLRNILLSELFIFLSTLCVAFFAFRTYRVLSCAGKDPATLVSIHEDSDF